MADSRIPLYRQIAQDLMRKIEAGAHEGTRPPEAVPAAPGEPAPVKSGALKPNEQLPNEDELRKEYRASRNTVRDAIKWLSTRGLVVTRPGLGTFVKERPTPFVTTLFDEKRDPEAGMVGGEGSAAFDEIRGRQLQPLRDDRAKARLAALTPAEEDLALESLPGGKPDAAEPTVEVKKAPEWVAERLRINRADQVVVRHQQFRVGAIPWSLQTTFYPMKLVVQRGAESLLQPDNLPQGTIAYLRDSIGLVQCGSRLRILVRPPNEDEARFFGLPDDGSISVISLIRTGYEDIPGDGAYPFRVTFTILPADRNQFVVNIGKVPEELAGPAHDQ